MPVLRRAGGAAARARAARRRSGTSRCAPRHPRAQAAALAAEAAGLQDAFWPFHDALFADQGRLEDPHLWARASALGLDLDRFDADRRSDAVAARVREHFRGGIRAGVATTPTLFAEGLATRAGPARSCGRRCARP